MNIYRRKKKDGKLASPFYYYRFKYGGRTYRGSTETTDAALARKILNKRYNQIVETGVLGSSKRKALPTIGVYAQQFLDGYALNKKTRGNDKSFIENSIKPAFGKKRLDEVTPSDVERWRNTRLKANKLRGEGVMSPASVRLEMACFKTIMGLAVRDGLIERNPVAAVKMPRVNNARDRVITPAEYRRLVAKVSKRAPYMTSIVALAYETGMRRGEILGLHWKDLQRRPGFAYLSETKNGTSLGSP